MAAGLSLQESRLEELRNRFETATREIISEEDLIPRLRLDAELDLGLADEEWLETQDRLAPFGTSNAQPLLFSRGVTPSSTPRVLKEKHLQFSLRQGSASSRAMWFNAASQKLPPAPWDLAVELSRNEYQGVVSAQILVRAVRTAE